MKRFHAPLTAALLTALLATPFAVTAHNDTAGKKAGPVHKEQKDWGIAGDAKAVKRTIEITMTDTMRFTPNQIEVRQGEVVKLAIRNQGQMLHELVIGTKAELDQHAALMLKFPDMEHEEPYMAHVKAGGKGELIWNFNRAGDFEFACLVAGHYQAGMVGKITVVAATKPPAVNIAQAPLAGTTPPATAAEPATQELNEGEVRKIDKENKKITLKHGEIKSLDMPPMTMVFQVKDPALLDTVKPGDKVRFKASREGGKMTVTDIQASK